MDGIIPSTENFAVAIWNQLEDKLPSGELHCVRLYETPRNYVEYYGD
jgi:6-pyruvoyltetrahydropterin/6-carboxytetrahydropterin synthase